MKALRSAFEAIGETIRVAGELESDMKLQPIAAFAAGMWNDNSPSGSQPAPSADNDPQLDAHAPAIIPPVDFG